MESLAGEGGGLYQMAVKAESEGDEAKTEAILEQAASAGDVRALCSLAESVKNTNRFRAEELYELAAESGGYRGIDGFISSCRLYATR